MDPNPNEVIGRPTDREVWLAPGWGDYKPITSPKPSGYTRVKVRDTLYADGRVVTEVLDENNQPIKSQILDQQPDDKQAERFRQAQAAAQRQTDQAERRSTSKYPSTYPPGHPNAGQPAMRTDYESGPPSYEPMPAAAANAVPAGSYPSIEGTRRPDGTYDNSQPVKVWHGPSGAVVKVEALDANEQADWERRKNQGAGVGSFTDAQIAANAQKNQPATAQAAVPGYPGWTLQTTKDANGNELTVYYPPNSKTPQSSLPAKPEDPRPPTFQVVKGGDGQDYVRSISVGPNGTPVITAYGPNGQVVASIPGEREKPNVTQVRGDDGQVYTTVTTIGSDNRPSVQTFGPNGPVDRIPQTPKAPERVQDPDTKQWLERQADGTWKPITIQGQTTSGSPGPPLPHIVVGMSQAALRGYREQLQAEVAAGRQTQAWANSRWDEAKDMATFAIQESTLQQREYETNVNANVNLAQSRLSYLSTGMGQAINFALHINDRLPPGSAAGGKAFAAMLGLQSINMARSGINDVKLSPTDTRSVIERSRASSGEGNGPVSTRLTTIGNVNAVEAQRQTAIEQLRKETGVSDTTDVGGTPRTYEPVWGGPGAPPSGSPGAIPAPATAPMTAGAVPPATAPATAQSEAAIERTPGGYVNHAIFDQQSPPPAPAPPGLFPGAGTPTADTGSVGISPDGTTAVDPNGRTAPVDVNRSLPTAPSAPSPTSSLPSTSGQPNAPGEQIAIVNPVSGQHLVVPAARIDQFVGPGLGWQREQPATPTSSGAPPSGPDLAVLSAYRPQMQRAPVSVFDGGGYGAPPASLPSAPLPLDFTDQVTGMPPMQPRQLQIPDQQPMQPGGDPSQGMPLALMRQKILNTPPWRLDDASIAWARANGMEDAIWRTPTMGVAG